MKYKNFAVIILLLFVFLFSIRGFLKGNIPIPADDLIGLYHPFRDLYSSTNPNGIAYKNSLITDPIRQQYPWKNLSISLLKRKQLPLWNPYTFAGTPHLGTLQSGAFYPLNLVFFLFSFPYAWGIFIISQTALLLLGMYWYLRTIGLRRTACTLGAIVYAFSGFSVAWWEWGTIIHTALWLPFVLISIDKVFVSEGIEVEHRKKRKIIYLLFFTCSLIVSFFAGHIQTFFYLFIFSFTYLFFRAYQYNRKKNALTMFLPCYILFATITAVQWIPLLRFITLSAREIDHKSWMTEGWFIPWQHLLQFFSPDFFGNPTTLNYWGVFNYGEFIGYVGVAPLLLAFIAIYYRRDKKTSYMSGWLLLSLLLALPTFLAKLPFQLSLPFFSSTQPTRLLFISDFTLSVLSALGLDYYIKTKKNIYVPIIIFVFLFVCIWMYIVLLHSYLLPISMETLNVAKNNMLLPTLLLITTICVLIAPYFDKRHTYMLAAVLLVLVTTCDLLRFQDKFTPFSPSVYLYPGTPTLTYLQKHTGVSRIIALDSRILPPNVSIMYHLQTVEGYDPLYLKKYGQLIAYDQGETTSYVTNLSFNRIVTPQSISPKLMNFLGIKYVLSLSDISSPFLEKVYSEGGTKIYENTTVFPRVFFVNNIHTHSDPKGLLKDMFTSSLDLQQTALIEDTTLPTIVLGKGSASITHYSENEVQIKTKNKKSGFLVLTDAYYPSWHATVDGKEVKIYETDYAFRGIFIPSGNHEIRYYVTLL